MYIEETTLTGPEDCPADVRALLIATVPAAGESPATYTSWHRAVAVTAALWGIDERALARELKGARSSWVPSRSGGHYIENGGPFES